MQKPVLIVGAGPVGLMAALWLAKLGQPVRIIDTKSGGSVYSKALALHAASVEMLDRLGASGPFLERGLKTRRVVMCSDTADPLAELTFDHIDSPHPYILMVEQSESERLLREALAVEGVEVEWETTLTDLTQSADNVVASFADGRVTNHPYVLGCDGGPSTVRNLLNIEFEGEKDGIWFVLADAMVHWAQPDDEVRGYLGDKGPMLFFPLPEARRYRMVTTLLDHDPTSRPELSEPIFADLVTERCPVPCTLDNFAWISAFQVRRRLAAQYRQGRVFLAGDAAHTHSPVGGMGMNTGLADVSNLCWKLDAVLRGQATTKLLDTYESERRPVAKEVLFNTTTATRAATAKSGVVRAIRDNLIDVVSSFGIVRDEAARRASMTAYHYSGPQFGHAPTRVVDTELVTHPESENPSVAQRIEFAQAPHPGSRAPDLFVEGNTRLLERAGLRPVLLLFDGTSNSLEGYAQFEEGLHRLRDALGDTFDALIVSAGTVTRELMDIATIVADPELLAHARYGASSEAGYWVRPDNYIAWRGQPMDFDSLIAFASAR